jgi:hypothetical protein
MRGFSTKELQKGGDILAKGDNFYIFIKQTYSPTQELNAYKYEGKEYINKYRFTLKRVKEFIVYSGYYLLRKDTREYAEYISKLKPYHKREFEEQGII